MELIVPGDPFRDPSERGNFAGQLFGQRDDIDGIAADNGSGQRLVRRQAKGGLRESLRGGKFLRTKFLAKRRGQAHGQPLLFGDRREVFRLRRVQVENRVGKIISLLARIGQRLLLDQQIANFRHRFLGRFRLRHGVGAVLGGKWPSPAG